MDESLEKSCARKSNYSIYSTFIILILFFIIGMLYENLFYKHEAVAEILTKIQISFLIFIAIGFLVSVSLTFRASRNFRGQFWVGSATYLPIATSLYYDFHESTGSWLVFIDLRIISLSISLLLYIVVMLIAAFIQNRKILKKI